MLGFLPGTALQVDLAAALDVTVIIMLQVNIMVECAFVKDVLKGDDLYELRLKFLTRNAETYPYREED
jgi:hypothetical protein